MKLRDQETICLPPDKLLEPPAEVCPKPKRTPGIPVEEEAPIYTEVITDDPVPEGDKICGRSDFDPNRLTCKLYLGLVNGWKKLKTGIADANRAFSIKMMDAGENAWTWLNTKIGDFDLESFFRATNAAVVWSQHHARGWVRDAEKAINPLKEELAKRARDAEQRKYDNMPLTRRDFALYTEKIEGIIKGEFAEMLEAIRQENVIVERRWTQRWERQNKVLRTINNKLKIENNDPNPDPPEAAGAALGTPYYYGDEAYMNEAAGNAMEEAPSKIKPVTVNTFIKLVEQLHIPSGQPSKVRQILREHTGCDHAATKVAIGAFVAAMREGRYAVGAGFSEEALKCG